MCLLNHKMLIKVTIRAPVIFIIFISCNNIIAPIRAFLSAISVEGVAAVEKKASACYLPSWMYFLMVSLFALEGGLVPVRKRAGNNHHIETDQKNPSMPISSLLTLMRVCLLLPVIRIGRRAA